MNYIKYIEDNTIRCEASGRGGGIEINLSPLLSKYEQDFRMTAYQNYLGGGMLGAIQSDQNFNPEDLSEVDQTLVEAITEELKKYLHNMTNHVGDEWEEATFEENQSRPVSAY